MLNKQKYVEKLQAIYKAKTGIMLPGEEALDCFENLICFVGSVTNNMDINKIILPKNYERREDI